MDVPLFWKELTRVKFVVKETHGTLSQLVSLSSIDVGNAPCIKGNKRKKVMWAVKTPFLNSQGRRIPRAGATRIPS
eukprot:308599-Pelagomonas_calceolata.AAC.1